MQDENGSRWYYQNMLLIEDGKIRLLKSPVTCKGGEMGFSASDGGFFTYVGEFVDNQPEVLLDLVECDYCLDPWPIGIRSLRLPIDRPSSNKVTLGTVTYTQGIGREQLLCPSE